MSVTAPMGNALAHLVPTQSGVGVPMGLGTFEG